MEGFSPIGFTEPTTSTFSPEGQPQPGGGESQDASSNNLLDSSGGRKHSSAAVVAKYLQGAIRLTGRRRTSLFGGLSISVGNQASSPSGESSDFYDVHSMLVARPQKKKETAGSKEPPVQAQQGDGEKEEGGIGEGQSQPAEREETTTQLTYFFHYPQSLYGPYAEKLPPISATSKKAAQQMQKIAKNNNNIAGELLQEPPATLAEHCAAQVSSRDWSSEWRSYFGMSGINLTQIGTRLNVLTKIADEFAAHVAPFAAKIVEEKGLSNYMKGIKPLPSFDHVFLYQSNIYVLACSPARVHLFGDEAAARRAALNEIRAVRTLVGAPNFGATPPLCCCVTHMGHTVFVSAHVPLPLQPTTTLMYGSMKGKRVVTDITATYIASQIAEYIPLAKHSSPDEAKTIFTPIDMKQFYCKEDRCTYLLDSARWMPPAVSFPASSERREGGNQKPRVRHPLEEKPNSNLTILFRPEYMRSRCQLPMDPDTGLPGHTASEPGRHSDAIDDLILHSFPPAVEKMAKLFTSKQLQCKDISTILHQHAINVRYLGRIVKEVKTSLYLSEDVRKGLVVLLEREITARTWKAVVYNSLVAEEARNMEEQLGKHVFQHFKGLVEPEDDLRVYWPMQMKPMMEEKFAYCCCPVSAFSPPSITTATTGSNQAVKEKAAAADPNSVQVLRGVRTNKTQIEKMPTKYTWVSSGANKVCLSEADKALAAENEFASNIVYSLLGEHASANADLIRRAAELIGVELKSDVRGKKVVVLFKPMVKSCAALILSPALDAAAEHTPCDVNKALGMTFDPVELCDAVEVAARQEIRSLATISSENDSRITLPETLLTHALIAKKNSQAAFVECSKQYEIRKNTRFGSVAAGVSFLESSILFAKIGRIDRAESAMVEGLNCLKIGFDGNDTFTLAEWLFKCASILADSFFAAGSGQVRAQDLPAERVVRVLEYLHAAVYILQADRHPTLAYVMEAIASFRHRYADSVSCRICRAKASVVCHQCEAESNTTGGSFDKTLRDSEKDAQSQPGSRTTGTTQLRQRGGGGARRVKKEEVKRNEDDVHEMFTKQTLSPIETIVSAETATAAQNSTGLLEGLTPPSRLVKRSKYLCEACAEEHKHSEKEHIMADATTAFSRCVKLMESMGPLTRAAGDATFGTCLVKLGVLQNEPKYVWAGIHDLTLVYGDGSKPVIMSELQLADVLIRRSEVYSKYGGIEGGKTKTIDVTILGQAEDVLKSILVKLLEKPNLRTKYQNELNRVVRMYHEVADLYGSMPAAKKEHQARHYLVDTLPPVLGYSDPLVGGALGRIFKYYTDLAAMHKTPNLEKSTALQTAGKYACQYLDCYLGEDDPVQAASILTEINNILKDLRVSERQVAADMVAEVKKLVSRSRYAENEIVLRALKAVEDIFRKQLVVVEETEQTAKICAQIDGMSRQIKQIVKKILTHKDRRDRYCQLLQKEAKELRTEAMNIADENSDPLIDDRVHVLVALHDDLMKDDQSALSDEENEQQKQRKKKGGGGENGTGGVGQTEEEALSNLLLENEDEYGSSKNGTAANRRVIRPSARVKYVSPYSILGSAPEDDTNLTSMKSTLHKHRGAQKQAISPQVLFRSSLQTAKTSSSAGGGGMHRRNSALASTVSGGSEKNPETVEQLCALFPQLTQTASRKNFSKPKNFL